MQTLALNLLGAPRFERDGVPVQIGRAKGVALLAYLAVMREAVPRERVLDLLWPESLPQAARKNMRNTLWELGEALGEGAVEQVGGALRLAGSINVDVHALEDGLLLLESGSPAALEAAAAPYRGPLLDGLALHEAPEFEIWLQTERERLAALYLRFLEQAIAIRRAAGEWQRVADLAQRALEADPLREAVHLALIEASVRLGRRGQAAQQYATLAQALRRELQIGPLPETTARYEALLADATLPPATPPARPLARREEAPQPFVGREAELAALDFERAQVAEGRARVVLISGDLGLGKTRLWRRWLETRTPEANVLATHALETTEPIPFGPVLALFRQPGPARTSIRPPAPLAPIWLAELTRLLPELAADWPDLPAPLALAPAEERGRLLQALVEAIRPLAAPLLLLIVDDLHWADPSTLDWLVYLVDQLRHAPLMLVGTYRPQDAPERFQAVVAGWQRQGLVRHLPLAHLSKGEAQALLAELGAPADAGAAAEMVRQSGGNPFFLTELLRAPGNADACSLAELVRARVRASVPARALQVLQAAAVLGDGATFAALQATSGRGEEEALDALDALDAAAVIASEEGAYRFVHPLVATIVYEDLGPARRAVLHRRAAEALERARDPHAERAAAQILGHYAAAGELARAAHYAERAAAQALDVGAFVEAASYARRALEWEPTPQRRFLLGAALIQVEGAAAAQAQLEAALAGFELAGDVLGAARASAALAMPLIGIGRPELVRSRLAHPSIAQAETLDPALFAQALMAAASAERQSQHYEAAAALLDRADALTRARQLVEQTMQITFERGNLLADRGDLHAALAAFAEAQRLADASSNPVFAAMAHNNLAYHSLLVGDMARAQRHVALAAEVSERYTLGFLWQYVASTAGEIALARGALDEADAALARAFDAAHAWGNYVHMANVRLTQALVALARDDGIRARALVEGARELLGQAADPIVRSKLARVGAQVA